MEQESFKSKETAKKRVTRKANPEETLARGPESGVESDEALVKKDGIGSDEVLAHGYRNLDADMDPFDNERNCYRMSGRFLGDQSEQEKNDPVPNERAYNYYKPAPGYGPKKKGLDQDGEDYGEKDTKSGNDLDD
jgi:hypothetical protein